MASCLDNIISVKNLCGETEPSLSGLDLFDAPEVSTKVLAMAANEEFITGRNLAISRVELATKLIKNDLQSVMAANNVLPNLTDITYEAATFKTGVVIPALAVNRGLVLYRSPKIKGSLRKTKIHNVYVYPLVNATNVTLNIYDEYAGGILNEYVVDLTANQINTFDVEYLVRGKYARVYINGDSLSFASSYLTCFTGCNGSLPNECGYVKSFYNDKQIEGKEGYGINIDFSCVCDYDEMLCGLAKGVLGNIVWLKSRWELMQSLIHTDRLNNWTVYNREEAKKFAEDLNTEYINAWNTFANSLPSIVENMRDSCIWCRGIRWQVNL